MHNIDWTEVWEGWRNHLIPPIKIKKLILEISKERLLICRGCQWNSKIAGKKGIERCLDCGCPLIAKTKCLSCYCELSTSKWGAVLSEEQDEKIINEDSG